MRIDLLRLGGISSLVVAALFAGGLVLGFSMGIDIYGDGEPEELLADLKDNEVAFLAWCLLSMATPLLFVPAALGFVYAAQDEHRPYLAVAGVFFGIAGLLAVIGYAFGPVLWDIADNYETATGATREALLHDGENAQSVLLVITGASYVPFGLGMIVAGVLSLRSGFMPAWLAWPTIAVGAVGLVPFVGFIAVVAWRIGWLAAAGVIMLRRAGSAEPMARQPTRPASPTVA